MSKCDRSAFSNNNILNQRHQLHSYALSLTSEVFERMKTGTCGYGTAFARGFVNILTLSEQHLPGRIWDALPSCPAELQ